LIELKTSHAPVKVWLDQFSELEESAFRQLKNMGSLPWVFKHIAVMPDVHFGKGATVGSVIAMREAIAPAAVGVDIGCGMAAVQTSLCAKDLPDSLTQLRTDLEAKIPVGFSAHKTPVVERIFKHGKPMKFAREVWQEFNQISRSFQSERAKALSQCGTLGGGNHYIELCLDEVQRVWMLLHSGSRNIGKSLAEYHIGIARKLSHNAKIPDKDLAVFLAGTKEMEEYRRDLIWAQKYAFLNRLTMLELFFSVLQEHFPGVQREEPILCHHNYVSEETHFGERVLVTRKGAISARLGEMGIIPGSMGAKSYIVKGLGNSQSFQSASHGAGRRLSRGQAKKLYTVKDLEEQTKGIECRKDHGVLDEIPKAYKDIDLVMKQQKDLVEVVHSLHQVLNIKG
jgi:tRNA-splicing ligase RtcB (3'-phosphate/5'-hydroxy nucleic acid ligase)